jgi:hypothetical protein
MLLLRESHHSDICHYLVVNTVIWHFTILFNADRKPIQLICGRIVQ